MASEREPFLRRLTSLPLAGILCVAAALRLAMAFQPGIMLRDDATYYVEAARQLAIGHGYLLQGKPTAYWPVGYPAFLSLFFHGAWVGLWSARLAQVVLSVASVALVYVLARSTWDDERAARGAALVTALLPDNVFYPALLLSEVVFTFSILSAVAVTQTRSRLALVASGALFGAAVLVRPVAALLPPVPALLDRTRPPGRRLLRALVVIAVMLGVTLPWSIRNTRLFGRPVWVSTNGGINAWFGNNFASTGGYVLTPEMLAAQSQSRDEVAFDSLAARRAREFVVRHPGRALQLAGRKLALVWSVDHNGGDTVFPRTRSWQRKVSAIMTDLGYAALLLLAALGIWRWRSWRLVLPLAVTFCITALYPVTVAIPRYHFPALPWIAVIAGGAFACRSECAHDQPRRGSPR